jgi:hypothetical protein
MEVTMRKYRIPITVFMLAAIVVFLFAGCDTNNGAPSAPPTVEETQQLLETTNVGYPPDTDPNKETFYYSGIYIIDLLIFAANVWVDPDVPWEGSDGTYSFIYSEGTASLTITLTIVWDSSREMWHYTLVFDGTYDTGSGIEALDNFTVFDLYAKPDGSEGDVTYYSFDSASEYVTIKWIKDSTYITFNMTLVESSSTTIFTLKETIPVYDEPTDTYISESGILQVDDGSGSPQSITWGPNPPSLS